MAKFLIRYEDGERIKNNDGEDMWYKTKKSAVYGAKVYAEKEKKKVIIIKGQNQSHLVINIPCISNIDFGLQKLEFFY